jgi:tRNA (adenine9-N1/guanine9-N1)-methyltransferase
LINYLGKAKIYSYIGIDFESVLYSFGIYRSIYLDPYSYEILNYTDLLWPQAVILGGIVDKPKIKRITSRLRELNAPHIPAKKIVLKGSIVGVPEELNILIKIIFDAIKLGDLDKAIIYNQSKRYKLARTIVELQKTPTNYNRQ